ncbi:hypothetical protein ABPG74_016651 [Tetrahymena malaccensis]
MKYNENATLLNKQADVNVLSSFTFMNSQQKLNQELHLGLKSMGQSQMVSQREIPLAIQVCNKEYFLSRTVKPFYKMVVSSEQNPESVMVNYLRDKRSYYHDILKNLLINSNLKADLADNIKMIEEKNLDYVFQDQEELMANNQFKINERIEREMDKHVRRSVRFTSFWPEVCIFKNIFDRASSTLGMIEGFQARDKFVYLSKQGRDDQVVQWKFFDTERLEEVILQKFNIDAKYASHDFKKQLRIFEVQRNQEYENLLINHDPQRLQLTFYNGMCSLTELNQQKKRSGVQWSEREILFMMYSITQNLIYLRKQKYFYQDIKPDNIIIYNIKKGQFGFKLANSYQTATGMLCTGGTKQLHGERCSLFYFGTQCTKIFLDPRISYKRNSGFEITEKDVEQANNYSMGLTILEILISNLTTNAADQNSCYIIKGWKERRMRKKQQQQQQQSNLSRRKDNFEQIEDFSVEFDELIDLIKEKYPRISQILREILVVKFQQDLQNIKTSKQSQINENAINQKESTQYTFKDLKRSLKDFEENQQPLFFVDDKQQSLFKVIETKKNYSSLQACRFLLQEPSISYLDSPDNQKNSKLNDYNKSIKKEIEGLQDKTQQNSIPSEVVKDIGNTEALDQLVGELDCCFSFGYLERVRILIELAKNISTPNSSYVYKQFNEMIEWYTAKLYIECNRFYDAITKLENLKSQLENRQAQDGLLRSVKEKLIEAYFSQNLVKSGMHQVKELIQCSTFNGISLNSEYLYKHILIYLYMTQNYTDCLVIIHNILIKYEGYINQDIYHPMIAKCMNLRVIILSQQGDHLQAFKQAEAYQKYVRGYFSQEKDLLHQPIANNQVNQIPNQSSLVDNSNLMQNSMLHENSINNQFENSIQLNQSSLFLKQNETIEQNQRQNEKMEKQNSVNNIDYQEDYLKKEQNHYSNQQRYYMQIQQNYYLEEMQCIGKLNYVSAALNVKAIQNKKVLIDIIDQIIHQIEDREGIETASPLYLFALVIKAKCCIHISDLQEAKRSLRYVSDSILTRHSAFDGRNYKIIYAALFAVKLINNCKFDTQGISKIQLYEWILQKLKSIQHGSLLLINRLRLNYSYALFQIKEYENAEKQSIQSINSNIFTLGSIDKSSYPMYSLDTKLHAYFMYKVGMFMANENSFKDALCQFNDCLRSMADLHNQTDYFKGECLMQKAYCQYHLKQFDQGLITALKACKLLQEESNLFNQNRPIIIPNQPNSANQKKQDDQLIQYANFNKIKESEKYVNPQQELFQATYVVAIVHNKLGNFNSSLDYCLKCIQLPISVNKDNMLRLGHCKMLAANNQKSLKRLVDSLALAEQSLNIFDKILPSHHPDLLQAVYLIFTILRDLQYFKEAKQQMKWVNKIKKAILKNEKNQLKSIDFQNMAMTWISIGQIDFGIEYLEKSLDINLKQKGLKHPLIAVDLINLAAAHLDIPNTEDKFKSIDFLEEAYLIFRHKENYEYEENIQKQPYSLDNTQLQLQALLRLLKAIDNSINFLTRDSTYLDQLKAIDIVHTYEKIGFMKQQRKLVFKDPYSKLQIGEFNFTPERFLGYTYLCILPWLNKHQGWLSVFSKKQYSFELDTYQVVLNIFNNNSDLVASFIKDPTPKRLCTPNILYNIISPAKEVLFTVEETQHRYKENEIYLIKNILQDKVGELEIAQKEGFPAIREMRIFLLDSTFSLETKYILCHLPLFLMFHRYGT